MIAWVPWPSTFFLKRTHKPLVPLKCINFIGVTAEVKTEISSIFNYAMAQLNKAWHHDDITKT